MNATPPQRRLFIAVAIADEIRHGLVHHLDTALDGKPVPGRPVKPPNWHLTLRFLGWADQLAYERVLAQLDQTEWGAAFEVGFGGLGAFPRPQRATVLWLGVGLGADRLEQTAEGAEEAALGAGFAPEERPFHPHLTLSRIRPHQDVRPVIERVEAFPLTMPITKVTLFESHLRRGGAEYEELEAFELG